VEKDNLHILELRNSLSGRKLFRKADLHDFYRTQNAGLTEQTFRRILYALEKQNIVQRIDSGIFVLGDEQTWQSIRKEFVPTFSPDLNALNGPVKTAFPYVEYIIWESRILHEFMLHQPSQNQIILEVEKDAAESVFNFFSDHRAGKVFLQPDRETFERYILRDTESIIILYLISRSPHQQVNGIPCPKLEKILVDIFADDETFFVFQGQELVHIYEAAFRTYKVSEKTLFWYAERRKVHQKIRVFINRETDIRLIGQEDTG